MAAGRDGLPVKLEARRPMSAGLTNPVSVSVRVLAEEPGDERGELVGAGGQAEVAIVVDVQAGARPGAGS
jgi:hypothetical protein